LVFGGTFERNPDLRVTCVEGDAGWVPHYLNRIDRGYREHSHRFAQHKLAKMPSEYFKEQVYLTFQEDVTAWQFADRMNWHRLMWANDFPHSDATWPNSGALLEQHSAYVRPEQKRAILCDNVAGLYNIDVESIPNRVFN
jgi:predicted TIM-barrel fold metal-dependent hydrolase